jgi:hypothetical protein
MKSGRKARTLLNATPAYVQVTKMLPLPLTVQCSCSVLKHKDSLICGLLLIFCYTERFSRSFNYHYMQLKQPAG